MLFKYKILLNLFTQLASYFHLEAAREAVVGNSLQNKTSFGSY